MSLLNKAAVRKLAQHHIEERAAKGGRKFTRIKPSFFESVEGAVRVAVKNRVHSAPSLGVTLE